jgi:hypothetical protein
MEFEARVISNEGGSLPWEDSKEMQTKEEERYERAQERRGGRGWMDVKGKNKI